MGSWDVIVTQTLFGLLCTVRAWGRGRARLLTPSPLPASSSQPLSLPHSPYRQSLPLLFSPLSPHHPQVVLRTGVLMAVGRVQRVQGEGATSFQMSGLQDQQGREWTLDIHGESMEARGRWAVWSPRRRCLGSAYYLAMDFRDFKMSPETQRSSLPKGKICKGQLSPVGGTESAGGRTNSLPGEAIPEQRLCVCMHACACGNAHACVRECIRA